MATLSQIWLFPIKSLDGIQVDQATVLPSGALQHDREFAIVDQQGKVVNGKRTAQVHQIRTQYDLAAWTVTLHRPGETAFATFHLDDERSALAQWLSDYFGFPVQVQQDTRIGFPDDTASPGPTVISTDTLQTLITWFPGLSLESMRLRLRSNLEISGVEPFWEERLYGDADSTVPFSVGSVPFVGVNPCQRCIVPTRDPIAGDAYPHFQKTFIAQRQATLPSWANASRFNHFYRLAVNTRSRPDAASKHLSVGDVVTIDS